MPVLSPIAIGIAQITCSIAGANSPYAFDRVIAHFQSGQKATIEVVDSQGNSQILEKNAHVTYSANGGLEIRSELQKTDWSNQQNKHLCYSSQVVSGLLLNETSYASYSGSFQFNLRLDFNPNINELCPLPMIEELPPANVVCAAAIH